MIYWLGKRYKNVVKACPDLVVQTEVAVDVAGNGRVLVQWQEVVEFVGEFAVQATLVGYAGQWVKLADLVLL